MESDTDIGNHEKDEIRNVRAHHPCHISRLSNYLLLLDTVLQSLDCKTRSWWKLCRGTNPGPSQLSTDDLTTILAMLITYTTLRQIRPMRRRFKMVSYQDGHKTAYHDMSKHRLCESTMTSERQRGGVPVFRTDARSGNERYMHNPFIDELYTPYLDVSPINLAPTSVLGVVGKQVLKLARGLSFRKASRPFSVL